MNNWFVITGAPGSGKTTTINILKEKGYKTTHEAARLYYETQMNLGRTNEQIKANPQKLQNSIAKMIIDIEKSLNPKEITFLDRGIPDNFAYYEYFQLSAPQFIKDAYTMSSYKKVFYLERLPLQHDKVRIETEKQVQLLARLAYIYYSKKKAEIIRVPVMTTEERIEYILSHI